MEDRIHTVNGKISEYLYHKYLHDHFLKSPLDNNGIVVHVLSFEIVSHTIICTKATVCIHNNIEKLIWSILGE